MQGFKSFADRTTLKIGTGITAIVGPNGCGKSNVSDGVRWVSGEKSAKSMRSPDMTGVIFSGTTKRKPLNFSEVTLVLTEVEGVLDTEYDEIAITRRLHRSGESQYMINRNIVRLKDIEDLLAGTGMGKNSMSVIAQGKVEEVIHCNPVERRSIIEEAAGTSLFIKRRDETRRKLVRTGENLNRVRDILVEVEKQKKTAERQAEKALIYQEKSTRLEQLDKSHLVSKWKKLSGENCAVKEKKEGFIQSIETTAKELEGKEKELIDARLFHEEREAVLLAKSESLYKVKSERDLEKQALRVRDEKMLEANEKKEVLILELKEIEEKIASYKKEQNEFKIQSDELRERITEEEAKLNEDRKQTEELDQSVKALRDQHMAAQRNRLELIQKESQVEGEWKQTKLRCDHYHEKRDQAKLALKQMIEDIESMTRVLDEKKMQMEQVSQSVDRQKEILSEVENEVKSCQDSIIKAQDELTTCEKHLTEARAQKKVLMKLKEEMQGFSPGTKKLIQASKKAGTHLSGKLQSLYEVLTLDERLPEALTVALRPYSQTLVVNTVNDFVAVLNYAREHGLKDFSILCLAHLKKYDEPMALLPEEEVQDIVRHFLHNIHVVETPESVFKLGEQSSYEYCTQDNAFIDRFNVVFYPGKEENNAFVREAELKTLNKTLLKLDREKNQLERELATWKEKRDSLQQKKGECDKTLRKEEMRHVEVNFALQRGISDLKKMEEDCVGIEKEIQSHETTIQDLTQKLTHLAEKHEDTKKLASETLEVNTSTESALEEKTQGLAGQKEALQQKEMAFQAFLDKKKELTYHLQVVTMRLEEAEQQVLKLQKEIERCQHVLFDNKPVEGEESDSLKMKEEAIVNITKSVDEERAKVAVCKTQIEKLEFETVQKRNQEKELIEKKNGLEIRQSQYTSTCEALQYELDERYQMSMEDEEISQIELIEDIEAIERELKSLRREVDKLGPVNMEAIEEKEEHAERYEFLTQQVNDLEESKEELLAIIEELEHESRKLYEETFNMIQQNFRKNFAILFRGGEADLKLVGSEDVLEAGIEIIAKPPGKQMRSITLLSGGEKCMTAMAFLFAIFEVKPSPFCILDEIDAPLDDSNIQRFVEVLKQFAGKCQFIVITHNKRTMAIADMIYGVTMEEKGVSKLLSIEFDKDKEYAEPQLV